MPGLLSSPDLIQPPAGLLSFSLTRNPLVHDFIQHRQHDQNQERRCQHSTDHYSGQLS